MRLDVLDGTCCEEGVEIIQLDDKIIKAADVSSGFVDLYRNGANLYLLVGTPATCSTIHL